MTHSGEWRATRGVFGSDKVTQDDSARASGTPLFIFSLVAALMLVDIAGDIASQTRPHHIIIEGASMLLMLIGLRVLLQQWTLERAQRQMAVRALVASQAELKDTSAETARWRNRAQDLLNGLGEAIDEQFRRWGLTDAERDIALLQLKGLTHKEIASIRSTSERTVRQHALSTYRKSGLGGRVELAAFFLEDLLLPAHERTPGPHDTAAGSVD